MCIFLVFFLYVLEYFFDRRIFFKCYKTESFHKLWERPEYHLTNLISLSPLLFWSNCHRTLKAVGIFLLKRWKHQENLWNQVRVNSKDTRATLLASFWSFGCSTLVGQHPMKLLSSVSVRLSVRPSLSFLKIGSLLSSDIVHDDSWPWYLMTDSQISEKKISAKIGPETRYFAIFSSLVD